MRANDGDAKRSDQPRTESETTDRRVTLSLPKGGGAIRGIGEKLTTNAATGTATLTLPVPVTKGRALSPSPTLSYDSGRGNGPFGLGWELGVARITRKTDKRLPRFRDDVGSDTFLLSDAEDLTPLLELSGGIWQEPALPDVTEGPITYARRRYRPRVDAAFSRIERWTDVGSGVAHWRVIDRANVTSLYGITTRGRVTDPSDPRRIAEWLLEEQRDDRGDLVIYRWIPEDDRQVDVTRPEERNRPRGELPGRLLKEIAWANPTPGARTGFHLRLVLDYGDHDDTAPAPDPSRAWPARPDAFSRFKYGFELRTHRLCQRLLLFHDFPSLGGARLVRSLNLTYQPDPAGAKLVRAVAAGYAGTEVRTLPAIQLTYSEALPATDAKVLDAASSRHLPVGLGERYQLVDLDGEGLAGILSEQADAWFYKRNLGAGRFGSAELVVPRPTKPSGGLQLADLDGDGRQALVSWREELPGFYARTDDGGWTPFTPFASRPAADHGAAHARFLDLDGDGRAELVVTDDEALRWYPSLGRAGFDAPRAGEPRHLDEERGPRLVFSGAEGSVFLADMSGDGLIDLVRVRNGEVCYWPNLGHGRFGAKVTMDGAPLMDYPDHFDAARVRLADIDGSGTSDLVYIGRDAVVSWTNASGNRFVNRRALPALPHTDNPSDVSVVDLLGDGTSCLVWSSRLPADAASPLRYFELTGGKKPHLLEKIVNGIGGEVNLKYRPSTYFYRQDADAGRPWATRMPFPVQCLVEIERLDHVSRTRLVTELAYHHGHYDGAEREFRGFGRVDQRDAETFGAARGAGLYGGVLADPAEELRQPPILTRTWFHTGIHPPRAEVAAAFERERWTGDAAAMRPSPTTLPPNLLLDEERHAARALKGKTVRTEVFALDDPSGAEGVPYRVTEMTHTIRPLQPAAGDAPPCFLVHETETLTHDYERIANDPRVSHALTLAVDSFGNTTHTATVAYGRRNVPGRTAEQQVTTVMVTHARFANVANQPWLRLGVPVETTIHEVNVDATAQLVGTNLLDDWTNASEVPFEATPAAGEKRLVSHSQTLYRRDDLTGPMPLDAIESRALVYETRQMALTTALLGLFGGEVDATVLGDAGYVLDGGVWWTLSGRDEYASTAAAHFYLPSGWRDPFDNVFVIGHDGHDLRPVRTEDPIGNVASGRLDYRVLEIDLLTDANENQTQVAFDALGRVTGTAVMGKAGQGLGDSLAGFVADLPAAAANAHFDDPLTNPQAILGSATMRVLYDVDRWTRLGEPPAAYTIARDTHVSDPGGATSRLLHSFVYWDGEGRELMKKVQAEPDEAAPTVPRWVGTGRVIRDNKGNAIKQYEPFFSGTHAYEDEPELVATGFAVIHRYDPLGRLVGLERPDGTRTAIDFDSWRQAHADENDLVAGSAWEAERLLLPVGHRDRVAAERALEHAASPGIHHLDAMGRAYAIVADNKARGQSTTRTRFDAEGNIVATIDDRGNATVRTFGPGKRILRELSPDAGARRTFADAAGKPCMTWNARGIRVETTYDDARRPRDVRVRRGTSEIVSERLVYGDSAETGLTPAQRLTANLRGKIYRAHDGAGTVTSPRYDFEGRAEVSERRVSVTVDGDLDWSITPAPALEAPLTVERKFDARGRIVRAELPDATVITTTYNDAGLIETVAVDGQAYVASVVYDAKGQRRTIRYGNGAVTETVHDPRTWRLTRLITTRAAGPELQHLEYTYDAVGNVIRVTDTAQQDVYFNNNVASATGDYVYDALYRLIEAHGREHVGAAMGADGFRPPYDRLDATRLALAHPNDGGQMVSWTQTYEHDTVGNLMRVVHTGAAGFTRRYQIDGASNRLTSTTLPGDPATGPLPVRYDHDADGNITRMPHLTRLDWDHQQRLSETALDTTRVARYRYDATGQRVRKAIVSGGVIVEDRVYLDGYEVHRNGGTTIRTVHVEDGPRRIAMIETENSLAPVVRYQFGNHLDSAVLELSGGGAIISYEEYYPFGGTSLQTGPGVEVRRKRYRYLARERDDETGLYYMSARYAAPWLGRWLSTDPAGPVDGTNLYVYARNNPIRLKDPTGTDGTDFQLPMPEILQPRSDTDRIVQRLAGTLLPADARFRIDPSLATPGLTPPPAEAEPRPEPPPAAPLGTPAENPGWQVRYGFPLDLTILPREGGRGPHFHINVGFTGASFGVTHLPSSTSPEAGIRLGYSYGSFIHLDMGTPERGANVGYDPHADRFRVQMRGTPVPGVRFDISVASPGRSDAGIPSLSLGITFGAGRPITIQEPHAYAAGNVVANTLANPIGVLNGVGAALRSGFTDLSFGMTPPPDFTAIGRFVPSVIDTWRAAERHTPPVELRGFLGASLAPWRPPGAATTVTPLPEVSVRGGLQLLFH